MKTPFSSQKAAVPSTANTQESVLLGAQLREDGKLTDQNIHDIVQLQRREKLLFGEAAVGLGFVSPQEIQEALSKQYQYPLVSSNTAQFHRSLVAVWEAFGQQAETFRTLRSQLILRWHTDSTKCLAVTSSRRGNGASAVAANLAIVFAQAGERTLLIDANLRQPKQDALFGLTSSTGLSTLLSGRCVPDDVFNQISGLENLYVIPAGNIPPNPQELLNRLSFSYLMETVPLNFDVVLVDTPAILDFSDAQLIAARANSCLLVARRDVTRIEEVQRAKALLEPTNARLVGAVICDS